MKIILQNLKKVLSKPSTLIVTIISILLIGTLFLYFKNMDLIIGNLGMTFFISELSLDIGVAILFGLFVGATVYKIMYFSVSNKKTVGVGGIASFFGILVSGCPSCSITLASYLGLASIISFLPYHGLELKIISFIMLLYVNYDILKTLEVCAINKKNNKF